MLSYYPYLLLAMSCAGVFSNVTSLFVFVTQRFRKKFHQLLALLALYDFMVSTLWFSRNYHGKLLFVTQLSVKYCHSMVMKVRFSNILMTISHNLMVLWEHEKSSGLVLIWKIFSGCRFMFNDLGTPSYLATVQKNLLPFLVNIFISYSTNCGYVFCLLYHCHVMGEICPDMPSYTLDRFISSIFWEYQILCIYTFHYYFSHLILHSQIFWGK